MFFKVGRPKLKDSVKSLKKYLHYLEGLRVVESWEEVIQTIFRKDHHLALQVRRGNQDLLLLTAQRLMDLLLQSPGCPSKNTVSRIFEAYCSFITTPQRRLGTAWIYDVPFNLMKDVLAGGYYCESPWGWYNPLMEEYLLFGFQISDFRFMRAIATYGVVIPAHMNQSIFIRICLILEKRIFESVNKREFAMMYQTLRRSRGRMDGQNQRGFRRIFGILQALYATCHKLLGNVSRAESRSRCLETYWDTLPDPLVSEEEVREFLLFVKNKHEPFVENLVPELERKPFVDVDAVMDAFVRLFGRRRRAYEPRRLSHLCRCTVRSAIVRNSPLTLPASVECLHLPESIETFILCNPGWRSQ